MTVQNLLSSKKESNRLNRKTPIINLLYGKSVVLTIYKFQLHYNVNYRTSQSLKTTKFELRELTRDENSRLVLDKTTK